MNEEFIAVTKDYRGVILCYPLHEESSNMADQWGSEF